MLTRAVDDVGEATAELHHSLRTAQSSRRSKYLTMNPLLTCHPIYDRRIATPLEERHCQAFTKLRVSAHSLAIETGRWNRGGRGRLPVE